jgi:WD40 repeat protein
MSANRQPDNRSVDTSTPTPLRLSDAPELAIITSTDITEAAPDVNSVAFSPDGTALIVATGDDYAGEDATWLYDAATGELLTRIPGQTDGGTAIVQSAAFHPDGTQLVCAYGNRLDVWVADPCYSGTTAERWRRTATPPLRRLSQSLARPVGDPTGRWNPAKWGPRRWDRQRFGFRGSDQAFWALDPTIFTVDWHPDSTLLVSASSDEVARIWDVQQGQLHQILSGHTAAVRSARFSPNGSQVLTASADGTARIWEVASGVCLHVLSGHVEALHSAEWSPDGTQIVTTCSDGTIGLWDGNDPDRLPRFITDAEEVASLAVFSADSAWIAVICSTTVCFWDRWLTRCHIVLAVETLIPGQTRGLKVAAWSPDSTRLAVGGMNAMVGVWNVADWIKSE